MGEELEPAVDDDQRRKRMRDAAVKADTEPRLLAAARWLRRRMPGDDRFGDPLSTAGDRPVEVLARQISALQPERPSVTHELGLGALQVWQSLSEASGRGRGDQDVVIFFTDLVGFSSWALAAGDDDALNLLREVGDALESAIAREGGVIVKRLGDGLMAVFEDVERAIAAADQTRAELADVEVAGYRPKLRFGIHSGRPRRLGGDYFGVDVNTAARIVDAAKGDEILLSDTACEQLDGERFSLGKPKRLRAPGAPKELRVVRVERSG